MTVGGSVRAPWRYPVKSLQGESLDHAFFEMDGVVGDREFAFVDTESGKVASAKRPRPWRPLLDCAARHDLVTIVVQLPDGRHRPVDEARLVEAIGGLVGRDVVVLPARAGQLGSYDSMWPAVDGVTLSGREFPTAPATDAVRFVDVAGLHLITTATIR